MEIKKENIKITSYIVGFHSFRKDHNYGNFKANLINDIQSLYDANLDTLKIGGVDILKHGSENKFEIRLTPSTVVYQDDLDFENITSNAKKILDFWLTYSPKVKLSLIGLVTQFKIINVEPPKATNKLRIKDQFFKNFKLGKKLKGVDFHFNYLVSLDSHEYNVHLVLEEKKESDYIYAGSVDLNASTDNKISGLSKETCNRVFQAAKKYFEEEIIDIINYNG